MRPGEGIGAPELEHQAVDGEPANVCWELNPGPLEQLLTAEASLQPCTILYSS